MYAIAFDLSNDMLKKTYSETSPNNAYGEIKAVLSQLGFKNQQGSLYFGDKSCDAVKTVLAAQELAKRFSWFSPSVKDIRMLRIEDNNDLRPAIDLIVPTEKTK